MDIIEDLRKFVERNDGSDKYILFLNHAREIVREVDRLCRLVGYASAGESFNDIRKASRGKTEG